MTEPSLFQSLQPLRVLDLILALIAAEAALGSLYFLRTGRGIPPRGWLFNAMAGGCLLLACRLAWVGAAWPWLALALTGALFGHLLDCRQRWK